MSPLRTSAAALSESGPPRVDWAAALERARFNSAFRSVTDACRSAWLVEER
jgi:hypothetical protein